MKFEHNFQLSELLNIAEALKDMDQFIQRVAASIDEKDKEIARLRASTESSVNNKSTQPQAIGLDQSETFKIIKQRLNLIDSYLNTKSSNYNWQQADINKGIDLFNELLRDWDDLTQVTSLVSRDVEPFGSGEVIAGFEESVDAITPGYGAIVSPVLEKLIGQTVHVQIRKPVQAVEGERKL